MPSLYASFALLISLQVLLFTGAPSSFVHAAPVNGTAVADRAGSSYWIANISRQGSVPFGQRGFQVFRNVQDFGARGDGLTDDTDAINRAISFGNRCGINCDSSTVTPGLVYFPPGTYLVSKPIIQYYYTQLVGDAVTLPTLKASPGFSGMAVIDSDPYLPGGANWYTNQNNFFRQIRNFVIDLTAMPPTSGTGIHWQVAQATSLQNIRFEMIRGGANNLQQGIFMDNGSGGFMTDLTFNGGNIGAFFGSQQFTSRNLVFNNCNTAMIMNWNWAWTFKSVTINNCKTGLDMSTNPPQQNVGSVLMLDSKIINTPVGIVTAFTSNSNPNTGGTLILDNVDFTSCATAVQSNGGAPLLSGGSIVKSWGQGRVYTGSSGKRMQGPIPALLRPLSLTNPSGAIFERSKPQYENIPASAFVSVKSHGAKGDGVTDDTAAIQRAMLAIKDGQILYFDHGSYVVTSTIQVPANIKIVGEIWPVIMAFGPAFSKADSLTPVFRVGRPGESGTVEMSDIIFTTKGPAPGAVLVEWNLKSAQGASGLWDVHFRVGGFAGTQLQSDTCTKTPTSNTVNLQCIGAGLLLRVTASASNTYVENCWFWVADHELDIKNHNQINVFNGRGVLIESAGPTWLWGTSSEHNVLYNYQVSGAKDVFMGLIQTETPYYQANPIAPVPFTPQAAIRDPTFSNCPANQPMCAKSWGLRVVDSSNVLVYGAGLYSFFENYSQTCLDGQSCQTDMVSIEGASQGVQLFGLSTKASVNMVSVDGQGLVKDADNRSNFCATLALWSK
ncbi:hypothetical protein HDU85_004904 [Gaertneriomyces sp. JEL0708]|nr:hypothetical protein HDU85_004904 [Gaertneriomyces sp. JEL0708]